MQNLKYRFEVVYKDGSRFEQNAEDVSGQDPKRSAFFDVKHDQVEFFALRMEGLNKTYGVSLKDGSFHVEGQQFFMHDGDIKDFRLIFFRRHKHHYNQQVKDAQFVGEGKEVGHEISYHFGWQGTDEKGKNIQRVMVLN